MQLGSQLSSILKSVVSSLVKFSSVYSVTGMFICLESTRGHVLTITAGSVDDGVLFRMLLSCLSVFSCSLLLGVLHRMVGSSAIPGLYSSTVLVLAVNIL